MGDRNLVMEAKLSRALREGGDFYNLEEIKDLIDSGTMQSFAEGDSWVVTTILDFPRHRVLDCVVAVGEMEALKRLYPRLIEFAKEIGADRIHGIGRDGWKDEALAHGWKLGGRVYILEISK